MKDIATAIFAILTSLFMICETETMSALLITKKTNGLKLAFIIGGFALIVGGIGLVIVYSNTELLFVGFVGLILLVLGILGLVFGFKRKKTNKEIQDDKRAKAEKKSK